jgi:hypothetical protein
MSEGLRKPMTFAGDVVVDDRATVDAVKLHLFHDLDNHLSLSNAALPGRRITSEVLRER